MMFLLLSMIQCKSFDLMIFFISHFLNMDEVKEKKLISAPSLNSSEISDDQPQYFSSLNTSQNELEIPTKHQADLKSSFDNRDSQIENSKSYESINSFSDQTPGGTQISTSYLTQVYFKPLFGSAEAMKELFEHEGFSNIHSIKLHDKYGFVRFKSVSEAQLFVQHFDKFDTGRATLTVQLSPKTVVNHPPCKRIYLTGYDSRTVEERDIYFLCAPFGFLRHISFHHEYSFIDYDTIEDASNAVEQLNKQPLKGKIIAASFAKASPLTDFSNLTIPLTDIIPSNHEFWTILADRLQAY